LTIAVITGGRERTPTLAELKRLLEVLTARGVTVVREGEARGTDKAVAAWLRARMPEVEVEPWRVTRADWDKYGGSAGHRRNRAMLDGGYDAGLFGERERPPADVLFAFSGGRGTANCRTEAAKRGIPIEHIEPVDEPRIWNRHHGEAPKPWLYVGRGSPLGNPFEFELREGETRAEAAPRELDRYKRWLWPLINPGGASFDQTVATELAYITADHHLVCSCWPRHCHAEVIVRAWRWSQGMIAAPAR